MTQLSDPEFQEWLNAVERREHIPSSLPPDDVADLQFAQYLFEHRAVAPPVLRGKFRSKGMVKALTQQQWGWRLATVALLVLLLLVAFSGSSGTARAQLFKALGLEDDQLWVATLPVIFEGKRYDPEAFNRLVQERLQEETLILVPDEDEDGYPILFAFRTPEEARLFLEETRNRLPRSPGVERSSDGQ